MQGYIDIDFVCCICFLTNVITLTASQVCIRVL